MFADEQIKGNEDVGAHNAWIGSDRDYSYDEVSVFTASHMPVFLWMEG